MGCSADEQQAELMTRNALPYQYDVDLTLGALPVRIVWLVKLPVVVELDDVRVGLCRILRHDVVHVLVL